jgi:MFS family permease
MVALDMGGSMQDFATLPATTTRHPVWDRLGHRPREGLVIIGVVALAKADAATVGAVAPALRVSLHVTVAQLGLLASLGGGTGALCALPAGGLVDRRHRPAIIGVAVVLWSVALGLAGFATAFVVLAVARLVSGGVATIARPVSVSLAGDLYQPEHRGRALAALDAGQAAGTATCLLLGAVAVHFLTWRWLFWGLAAAGIALALGARGLDEPVPMRPPGPRLSEVLRVLVHIRTNLIVLAADSVSNFFFAGVASFSVLFITERYGLSNAGVDALAPVLAVGVMGGIIAGGRLGDRLTHRAGGSTRLAVAAGCQLIATVIFAAALLTASVVPAGVLLFFGASILGGAGPCLDAVRLDIVYPSIRGRAEAAKGLLTLASSALGPLTFGLVATALSEGGRSHALALRDTFLLMLIPLAAGALILIAARGPYATDAAAASAAAAGGPGVAEHPAP